jgi:hypothetical protein
MIIPRRNGLEVWGERLNFDRKAIGFCRRTSRADEHRSCARRAEKQWSWSVANGFCRDPKITTHEIGFHVSGV